MNRVLIDREQRANEIARLLNQHDVVLSIHANIPGMDKNIFPSTWLVKTLSSMEPWSNWKSFWYDSEDGAYVLILPEGIDPMTLKQQTVSLEKTHPLGRFIDLDVHTPKEILHRNWPRPCIVCGKDALSCRRNQRHTVEEVLEIIQSSVLDEIVPLWHDGVRLAMDKELSLDPKFGLVTPLSQGSHLDMNADLMKQAQKVILPFFSEAFRFGAVQKKIEDGVMSLRQRGINTENNMFQATQGVNCYKGLIFDLGFFSYAVGFAFAHAMSYENVRHLLTKMMMVPE
ncbi:MAG: citrate lyase holo-[acyl-carrier protein] synthase, partial [Candidatus Izemoplasmatales bacterium]|nr:citrate lyase holo-[acyl-carrier protein] synthase [Candidatus Izemoplasmatales bacterium]